MSGIEFFVGDETQGAVIKGATGYSVSEESTPVDPSDSTGAAGRFTATFQHAALDVITAKRLNRKPVRLTDRGQGFTNGIMRTPSQAQGGITLSADSITALLAVTRTAGPFQGTVAGYIEYLLNLVGITSNFVIDDSFSEMAAVFPGWRDEVWLRMKRLLVARGGEVSPVSGNIVFRPIRERWTVDRRDSEYSWAMDESQLAQSVTGIFSENTYRESFLAYPPGGWSDEFQPYQVDAGEIVQVELDINASLVSVEQPIAREFVGMNDVNASVYSVVGSDDLPIMPAQWQDAGGYISVAIGEDTKTLLVTICGANLPNLAPFRIAASAGPSNNYSSLRILGTGVFFDRQEHNFVTGLSGDVTSVESAPTVDNEFFEDLGQFYDRMAWTLSRYGGARHTVTVRTSGIANQGDSGSYEYANLADFDLYAEDQGWQTLADMDAYSEWETLEDFDVFWEARVASNFSNQAFGNVAGARTLRDGLWYRIRSATIGPDSISYTAEDDTTLRDFDDLLQDLLDDESADLTLADFDDKIPAGMTLGEFDIAPMNWGNF